VVEGGPGDRYPGCVGGGDAQGVYADGGELVDGAGVYEGLVPGLEDGAAAGT
jgi:hypothetical protein